MNCQLCHADRAFNFHHFIPRTVHSNKWFKKNFTREEMRSGVDTCRDCHRTIHRMIGEKELGRFYNTRDKLLAHPQFANYLAWKRRRSG
jgi:hypothetical protein